MQFPPRNPRSSAKTRTHCRHAFWANRITRSKRSIRGKSNHGSILQQPCSYYLRGTCTRMPCEYWRPAECQFYKSETGCEAGDKCLFPHYKVDDKPNKKPKKSHFPKRRESDDKNAVAFAKSVTQLGCVSQDSDALVSQGKKSQGNPMQKVLEPIQRIRFTESTPRRASIRETKGPSLGKINVKALHQRSPYAIKFPTARCKQEKKRQYMSNNWTYLSKLCFLKKLPQFFPLGNSLGIMGKRSTGPAVENHISSEVARKLNAKNPTMYHLWFLDCQRVLPHPHLHLHHSPSSSQESISAKRENIDIETPVPERRRGTNGEPRGNRCKNPQK